MRSSRALTTADAAEVASVAPSTIKRWADQGMLPFTRTAGGHRRFERLAVEQLLREPSTSSIPLGPSRSGTPAADPAKQAWIRCLVDGRRHEIDGRMLEARSRHASWCQVADELAAALGEMGRQWADGHLTIAQEHIASDALMRALARIGDTLPVRLDGPKCLLACTGQDDHTLGLSLAELCLREAGWTPLWLGRRTPVEEVIRLVKSGEVAGGVSMVALSASSIIDDARALRAIASEVGKACARHGAGLLLGGSGRWPDRPRYGVRLTSFSAFRTHLAEAGARRAR